MALPIASPSLESVFESLSAADIARFVTERRQEDLTLEFKLAPRSFANKEERRILACAVSGFANSSGGLVVWGIEAKPDSDGVDCAQATSPLPDPDLFLSKLLEHGGAATSPTVSRVVHRIIDGAPGPFAVTFVPESDLGPHMAKLGEDRYYKRSGSRFYKMEHFDIADMFGRRAAPVLKLCGQRLPGDPRWLVVSIENDGRGAAIGPYVSLHIDIAARVDSPDHSGNWPLPRLSQSGDYNRNPGFGGDATLIVHPGTSMEIARVGSLHGSPAVRITFRIAAQGSPVREGVLDIPADSFDVYKA
jgi:Schlafen, AlbA_2